MAHHIEARYTEDDGLFLPPLRTLGFNPQLRLNDSLLVQSYIETYDISYPEAMRRIEAEVAELKQSLINEGFYELNGIGTLTQNAEGIYNFEPCEAGILTPELYGLGTFEMKPLENAATATIVEMPARKEEEEDDNDGTIRVKLSWIRNTVAAAAVIIALFLITPPIHNGNSIRVNRSDFSCTALVNMLQEVAYPLESNETCEPAAPAAEAISIPAVEQPAPAVAAEPAASKAAEEATEEEKYFIVLASTVPLKNAERYVNQLHKKGLDKAKILIHNKIVRVVYGGYSSESDANNDLTTMRSNEHSEFEEAWIYKKK